MKNKKVFFIGDVGLDEYYSAPYFPKLKEKVLVQTLPTQMGGSIANAACVYTSFGQKASFLTALNPSPISKKLCNGLNEAGIDTSFMVWDESLPESKSIIILAENEHTLFIPTMNLQKMEISDEALESLCNADYIYSTFCELRPICHKGKKAKEVLTEIKKHGCRLWCDLDVGDIRDTDEFMFDFVDTLFINEKGYERLTERAKGNDVIEWLFSKGISVIVVTEAEHGCTVYSKNEKKFSVSGIVVDVVDVTGAGDTFCSAFLYAHTQGLDLRLCAEFANCVAARAVTGMGARSGAVGTKKVIDFMHQHNIDDSSFAKLEQ